MANRMSRRRKVLLPAKLRYKRRRQVFARDRGICSRCGLDGGKVDRVIRYFRDREGDAAAMEFAHGLGLRYPTAWNCHHRVQLGAGGSSDLDNLVTLCQFCHDAEHGRAGPPRDAAEFVATLAIDIPEEALSP